MKTTTKPKKTRKPTKSNGKSGGLQKVRGVANLYVYPPNGKYYIRLAVKGRKAPKKECLETTDIALAKRLVESRKVEMRSIAGDTTMLELARMYEVYKKGVNEEAIGNAVKRIEENPAFASQIVRKIQPHDISAFVASERMPKNTNNKFVNTLKSFFEYGITCGFLFVNPMLRLKLREKVVRTPPNIPTVEQFEQIRKNVRENRLSDTAEASWEMLSMIGLLGIGEAEARAMDWKDFIWDNGKASKVKIQRIKTSQHETIPVYEWAKDFVETLWEKRGKPNSGKVLKVATCARSLKRACELIAGSPVYVPRNFRQMCIVRLIWKGVNIKLISKWQLHQDGGILILRLYSQVISDAQSDFEEKELAKLSV